MYASRSDGVMLRPSWPLSSLDVTFTRAQKIRGQKRPYSATAPLVWAAHDDFGPWRWSYIVGINMASDFSLTPKDLQGAVPGDMVAWEVQIGATVQNVTWFTDTKPLAVPACPPQAHGPGSTIWAVAPVLPGGIVLLGDTSRWSPMSSRRVSSLTATSSGVTASVSGAKGESVNFSYKLHDETAVKTTTCNFSAATKFSTTQHGDQDYQLTLKCDSKGCTCAS